MRKIGLIIAVIFCAIFIFIGTAFADRGVFNAKVTPNEMLTTESPKTITVTAEIGSGNLFISSVQVYQTTPTGQPIALIGKMYDDGTHGDVKAADTIFTTQFSVNQPQPASYYVRVMAVYRGHRNRYMSPVLEVKAYADIPDQMFTDSNTTVQNLTTTFNGYLAQGMGLDAARQAVLVIARNTPDVTEASLNGDTLSILFANRISGVAMLDDPNAQIDGGTALDIKALPGARLFKSFFGRLCRPFLDAPLVYAGAPPGRFRDPPPIDNIAPLPDNLRAPGNNKLLIFAPGYSDASPQNQIADHALAQFNVAAWMNFDPKPPVITADANASLDVVTTWGNYGTVIIHTHGGFFTQGGTSQVILRVGTPATLVNKLLWILDLAAGRIGVSSSGKFIIYPSFVTQHCGAMNNTFFYLGACESLHNDTMWNALMAKGAKVGFGWSLTVNRAFNAAKFQELIDPMLPTDTNTSPLTAIQAFNAIGTKVDPNPPGAVFTMRTAAAEWNNFTFVPGGIINGGFETGDFTGWTLGASYVGGDSGYQIISGARQHSGSFSAALGRWDTAFHGIYDPTAEPDGSEWIYQDFVVPQAATYLKFDWFMETYDTAAYDWFDAAIQDTSGNTLISIVSQGGKPGLDYGPYWTTGGWIEQSVDISAYRGQKIRIYFDQRLDGFGDQTRTYIDDVRLE
jgi:hypothetical protein